MSCTATTRANKKCKNKKRQGLDTCHIHARPGPTSKTGILYAMKSQSVDGIKIGRTAGCPHKRAKDLSTTGVPTPFVVLYTTYRMKNSHAAEKKVFAELARNRISPQREFFRIGIKEAVEAMKRADEIIEPLFRELRIGAQRATPTYPAEEPTRGQSRQPRKAQRRWEEPKPRNTSR